MNITVDRDTEVCGEPHPVRLFLTVRPARTALAGTVLLGVLVIWFGLIPTPIPTAVEQGRASIPLWRMLGMGAAVLPVLALHSPLADLEEVATQRLRSMQRYYLTCLAAGSAVIYLAMNALVIRPQALAVLARAWLAWFGLALLAGAVLGWRLAWALPSGVAVVLWYWGLQGGDQYWWWEFSSRPYNDVPSLLLSVALLAIGVTAYVATPWRRRRWIFWRS